jgi:type VI secretion system secreted protein Hcp
MCVAKKGGKEPDTNFKGEVTESKHKEWIACDAINFPVKRGAKTQVGSGQVNRTEDKPTMGDIEIIRTIDKSSPFLMQATVKGVKANENVWTVFLHFLEPASNPDKEPEVYLKLKLRETVFTGYELHGGAAGAMEKVLLNYTAIDMIYAAFDETGAEKTKTRAGFKLTENAADLWGGQD